MICGLARTTTLTLDGIKSSSGTILSMRVYTRIICFQFPPQNIKRH